MNKDNQCSAIHWLDRDSDGKLSDSQCDKCGKPVGLFDTGITKLSERWYNNRILSR